MMTHDCLYSSHSFIISVPVATGEDINELVRQVANVDNELEGEEEEEEELALELEEILKTCDVIQTKVGREVDEKTEQGST